MSSKQQVKTPRGYYDKVYADNVPASHEWVAGTASPELIKLVWENVIKPNDRVLEIGSGVGTEAVFLAIRGMYVTGIDLSSAAVELGRKLSKFYGTENANFLQMDALNLEFDDDSFDVVCDHGVFHHLRDEERDQYAQQVARVLKKGGMLFLRSFSDKMKYDKPQPRLITSRNLTDTFLPYLTLEHMKRVLSFSTPTREQPIGWFTLWTKNE